MKGDPWMFPSPWFATASDVTTGLDYAGLLSTASPALMLAIFILALSTRRIILPRELDDRDKRIHQLEIERDEYKAMAFRALNIGERVATVSEERGAR